MKGSEKMNDNNTINLNTERKPGGLYRNIKMSVKTADRVIVIGVIVLIACLIFAINHAGFTVSFNTDGGSQIENQKVMYGQLVSVEENPVKEGYTFTGWYTDKDCQKPFDITTDKVSDSMTLYSGWEKK